MIHLRQVKTQCYVYLWIFVIVLNMNFPLSIIHNDSIIDISWSLIHRHNLPYSIQFNSRDISNEIDN